MGSTTPSRQVLVMKTLRPLALAALLLAGLNPAVQAQKLSVTPAPGLWENSMTFKVNGVDMMAALRAAQAEAMKELKNLPPDQRAMMEQMMQQALDGAGGPQRSCLTPEQARVAADPQALLRQMSEDGGGAQECRFELVSVSGNTLNLRGTCKPEEGWNGVVNGSMTLHDARRWSSRFSGQGRMQGEMMPGLPAPGGVVEMLMEGSGRWLGADCGSVAPER
jgi:hypothetical protein